MELWHIWLIAAILFFILEIKYIETLKEMTSGKDGKTVYMPFEATSMLGSIGYFQEMFKNK